ncbi:hypothetical protein GGR51DRAFT_379176 [Nemania sp. FL0031]|nr:hypothetical protein GGR51DRAFT_379176 [Nemania sp. FL0031]
METEQQPATITGPARPKEPLPASPKPGGPTSGPGTPQALEVRDYEFFAQRDFNGYKDASRAYFAEKNVDPSSWLGDATPPASPRHSLEDPRPAPRPLPPEFDDNKPRNDKILGLSRKWFLALVGVIGFIFIVAVGVGVGVGTSKMAKASRDPTGSAPASDGASVTTGVHTTSVIATAASSTITKAPTTETSSRHVPLTTGSSINTPTTTTPAPQVPTANSVASGGCPDVNETEYQVPDSSVTFRQLCGIDYGTSDGAVDIRDLYRNTATDCMDYCAQTPDCEGAGWGYIDGDDGPPFRCWLKRNVTSSMSHKADTTWFFALLVS